MLNIIISSVCLCRNEDYYYRRYSYDFEVQRNSPDKINLPQFPDYLLYFIIIIIVITIITTIIIIIPPININESKTTLKPLKFNHDRFRG